MDMNLNSINTSYSKATQNVGKAAAKFNLPDVKTGGTITQEQKADSNSDKVSFSSNASKQYEIYKATKGVMKEIEVTDVNNKVEGIKTQIDSKTYQISPEKIAAAILSRWSM